MQHWKERKLRKFVSKFTCALLSWNDMYTWYMISAHTRLSIFGKVLSSFKPDNNQAIILIHSSLDITCKKMSQNIQSGDFGAKPKGLTSHLPLYAGKICCSSVKTQNFLARRRTASLQQHVLWCNDRFPGQWKVR